MTKLGWGGVVCLLICIAVSNRWGTSPKPRNGWAFVPGAQDLIQAGEWDCVPDVALGSHALSISAPSSGYRSPVNTSGPRIQTQGDFSVLATLSDPGSSGGFLTLVGALATGSSYWTGLKRLAVGLDHRMIRVESWTGSSPNSTSQAFALPAGTSGAINLEVARIGKNIVLFVDGSQIGNFAEPGLFASGQAYFGFNVAPGNTLNVLALSAAKPAGSNVSLFVPDLQVAARASTSLRDSAPSGLLIGAAPDRELFLSTDYAQALGREFNLLVPGNDLKFVPTEPAPHVFNFCRGDQMVAYARANGMKMRGHTLVWWEDVPAWLTSGNYSRTEAAGILEEHITTVMGHFKGKLVDWDVVNEAVSDRAPYGLRPSYWLTQLGDNYVDMSFRWAHAADPRAKLFYNDYDGDGLGGKSDGIYNFVRGMLSRGVPINGVGLQMHVTLDDAPSQSDISTNMTRLGALGLEVHISEMDVRLPVDSNGIAFAADLASQAAIYRNAASACVANSNCTAFLTWGVSDRYSWIPSRHPGYGAGFLLDRQYNPKPAYRSLSAALHRRGR
jgi:endo-1,4-beta-xylanase